MTTVNASTFADEWIAAWNSHDLDRILSHYASDVVLLSPFAEKLTGRGRIEGMPALRNYWSQALAKQPNLHFDFVDVRVGHECLTILYRNHRGQEAAETFEFETGGKVVRSFACYA